MQRKGSIPRLCAYCGAPFTTYLSYVKQGAAKHCSMACSFNTRRRSLADRFWARVAPSPDPDGCWLWTGATTRGGYGVAFGPHGRMTTAHRIAWMLLSGPIPEGMDLCHDCPGGDTKLCVRPSHMLVGSRTFNMRDLVRKGGTAQGNRAGKAKLTEASVAEIRLRYAAGGISAYQLAPEYGVSHSLISLVVARRIWKHVP